ncbi:hypothetical protein WJX84_009721 [Apatococcus fuscideae]|uniref:Uncharacterized protein n=1 Tax=Apatococcus fuscideae TaxID=2026836 RepID=A0AAW1T4R2_9CHLO
MDPAPHLEKGRNLEKYFASKKPAGVVVGFGVRGHPEHTYLFEQLVKAVRAGAPKAVLMFNTSPDTTLEALKRWLPVPGGSTSSS